MKGKGGEEKEEKNASEKSVWGKEPPPPHLAPSNQPTHWLPLHLIFSTKHPLGPTRLPQMQGSEASPHRELLFFAGTSSWGRGAQRPEGKHRTATDSGKKRGSNQQGRKVEI